ncbi:MAG: restriction endonuclease [Balneola sp.]|nr:restriction endonuclease [Balneola sp.]MBO6650532.1 restriction endonuclease [Balneola sp.]MBO6711529.1 restriction endonuclease [Balneola sp.]MBO6799725.1 restriction endonuclease [Balneola sp.]MBO6870834.1 restriction endonuclease [Balneola sp.]
MIDLDEQKIRDLVYSRKHDLQVTESWYTPAGNQRSKPTYEILLVNEYLNKSKRVKKSSVREVELEIENVLRTWNEQEIKQRIRERKEELLEQAQEKFQEKKKALKYKYKALENILNDTIHYDDKVEWQELKDFDEFKDFNFETSRPYIAPKPKKVAYPKKPVEPEKELSDKIFGSKWSKKLDFYKIELEAWEASKNKIDKDFDSILKEWEEEKNKLNREWEEEKETQYKEWEKKKEKFESIQKAKNLEIDNRKRSYEEKNRDGILNYFEQVFVNTRYPQFLSIEHNIQLDESMEVLVVDIQLPNIDQLPSVKDYKFKKTTGEVTEVHLKESEKKMIYDSVINQIVVRTAHEVFESDYKNIVQQCVINGWLTYLNTSVGKEETSCVITVSIDKEKLENINLELIEPVETIKFFKGIVASSFSDVAPVQPIMKLDKGDRRFVESQAVLATLNSTTNLASIDWEEFEHLVRELFESMFSEGDSEVRVTQASSDGGIDAIAFDPDPIKGGKFVIQAKRYTKVVPVSAVRDLYGTMISEGASKGILVTTAHFGNDSREFIKNKPISLINGSNLVYLLEEHGYKVRIDIDKARKDLGLK